MLLIVNKEEAAFWLLDVIVGNLLPGMNSKPLFCTVELLRAVTLDK